MMRQLFPRASRAAGAFRLSQTSPRLAGVAWQSTRLYSVKPEAASAAKPVGIDASKLTIEKTKNPGTLGKPEELVFGRKFTDHMLTIEWNQETGWLDPKIVPYQNLSLDPATCVFHYAFECFEGMKAYKDKSGQIRLFRPDKNMARLNKSAARIALPTFEPTTMIELISKFANLEKDFIPDQRGYSLYLRPTMIGTQKTLGVGPPGSALLYVIASPVGPYYPTGFKAVSLEATDYAVRAWPGGVGDKKLGANYAPCIVPQLEAASRGHQQNLWLFGEEEYVTEVGTMNMFAAIKNKETGQKELVTAPLDGTILEGVTRDSVLALARERLVPEGWMVSERKYTMKELEEASNDGRLIEAFGAGTAAIVSPIRTIAWKGKSINCGLTEAEESGEIALRMKGWMEARQYGDEEHEWSYVAPA
ncbi:Branched-chain-amino-acid aminotransferase cytosolic [Colletotrichum gloeosporioides]|uniref:Branched-chain-amino-acid aminotransferase n=2 Tax=Colletotrichum gloeosporioides TaxID=474922 RepID=T0KXD3_COLGC|nr:Branched-chain-amino-acid aminotransferase cytosolic [Colletotrichum gloeosporioides]EQB56869.1 branched-chain amino acid aminotransferase [Colletotrichum gloeosporioides Cg-14]KAF3801613.1 Branched-chain-amino-acid aminotransferase cytosolic [Colletotrichum gloeosporioides]